jgi:hypothetical protein
MVPLLLLMVSWAVYVLLLLVHWYQWSGGFGNSSCCWQDLWLMSLCTDPFLICSGTLPVYWSRAVPFVAGKFLVLHLISILIALWFELILHWSWPFNPLFLLGCCCCSDTLSRFVAWSSYLCLLYVPLPAELPCCANPDYTLSILLFLCLYCGLLWLHWTVDLRIWALNRN